MRHIKILDPGMDIRSLSTEEIWGDSAIHPTPLVCRRVAASVIRIAENIVQAAAAITTSVSALSRIPDRRVVDPDWIRIQRLCGSGSRG
jgi:hypothetical protein